ncbi:universal stress protein [Pseudomonas sp. 10B1]|uniref:universal stress protein n=1 Tax=unclassified Pseudomonas TaxID=196821 RepID=UPI002AB4146A|nr:MULTISPECIES: universal stress protein [unclassified Pseudomonas]MDY7559428.1 universal stress protein [Pseudomonas sp. AB6]MEA9977229.1 universal stress protein [Pseudomonas sp. RTS4]MEA9995626.1 universal stress protein [Pseudomonas sp. AA4]MEB0087947.1 universal stress protein [Pseudomonas sp. RTI1]MEB0127041.1 universal stress protein [Pseudomonas sp. CCC1.2]
MQAVRSILVIIEPHDAQSLALTRAKLIACVTQAHLHLLICDKKHDHSLLLEELKEDLLRADFNATAQQAWNDSTHQTIIDVQQAENCGLVIKQHFADNPLKKALLTPDDWKLLRKCPSAVLMVKTATSWTGGVILAAVDVGNTDDEHRALHFSIVDYGFEIAAMTKGQLHVIAAHPSPLLTAVDPALHIEARYQEQCLAFQTEFDVDDSHLHIAEGPADVLIPHTAHTLNAAVTIIGTVGRTGISGALIGNTAEVILDSLESDVLVLKTEEVIAHLEELAVNG